MRLIPFFLIFIDLTGCTGNSIKQMTIDDAIVVGNISEDTIFNGNIRHYNLTTHKLMSESNYENGLLNGISIEYYPNGTAKTISSYTAGKINGFVSYFDSTGKMLYKDYRYYGLKVGEHLEYKEGIIKTYQFYLFDTDAVFEINYDSIRIGRRITDLQKLYFFYNCKNKLSISNFTETTNTRCRLYLISPPKYEFRYHLVLVDDNLKVLNTLKTFERINIPWVEFDLEPQTGGLPKQYYALRLSLLDSTNNGEHEMIKALPTYFGEQVNTKNSIAIDYK